jgi:hypothetical protein
MRIDWNDHLSDADLPNTGKKAFKVGEVYTVSLGPVSFVFEVTDIDSDDDVVFSTLAGDDNSNTYFPRTSEFGNYCQLVRDVDDNLINWRKAVAPRDCKCDPSHPHNEKGCYSGMCGCRVPKRS